MAQAPGQKGAFVPDSSELRWVDTKPLTTDARLPVWSTKQGIGLSHRGDPGLAPPGWFGHGLLTRPSSATAVSDPWPVIWRPSVSRTAGSGDPRRTKDRGAAGTANLGRARSNMVRVTMSPVMAQAQSTPPAIVQKVTPAAPKATLALALHANRAAVLKRG